MALFNLFKKKEGRWGTDHIVLAETFESRGDFISAIQEYEKAIKENLSNKEPKSYRPITKKIVNCYVKLGDYDKVFEMWKSQYDSSEYGPKEMYELIKILENGQKNDKILEIYEQAGKGLLKNKINFLVKMKKIPEAYEAISELLSYVSESTPGIEKFWLLKAKLAMNLGKWEDAKRYLNKIVEKDSHNTEARKLKDMCMKHAKEE
jgi:pentatricopeptide repeat protein